ncbi:hypothetical protein V6C21_02645 [[Clostridium] cellulosi]
MSDFKPGDTILGIVLLRFIAQALCGDVCLSPDKFAPTDCPVF